MDKRFQVFVSSTFRDLREERNEVVQALLEMDCIPAGMEMFPAANDDAWSLIQRIIKQSDYYVLIIGGRYGSLDTDGLSYTEKEYAYAVSAGITVIPFLHKDPGKIAAENTELDPTLRSKLAAFRSRVESAHHCKYWSSAEDLGSKVSRALLFAFKQHPAIGWIRADQGAGPEALAELNRLRLQIDSLKEEVRKVTTEPPKGTDNLRQGGDYIPIKFSCMAYNDDALAAANKGEAWKVTKSKHTAKLPLTWDGAFAVVGPLLFHEANEKGMKKSLEDKIPDLFIRNSWYHDRHSTNQAISADDFQTIKVQLIALGLIRKTERKRAVSDTDTYWTLTPYGESYLMRLRALRADESNETEPDEAMETETDQTD